MTQATELHGLTVVYLVAIGLQIFILIFILVKRQIMRFTRASKLRNEPFTEIGKGFPKSLKNNVLEGIEETNRRRLDAFPLFSTKQYKISENSSQTECRGAAMAEIRELDKTLSHMNCRIHGKAFKTDHHQFYFVMQRLQKDAVPDFPSLSTLRIAHLYEWSRFQGKPFTHVEYGELRTLIMQFLEMLKKREVQVRALKPIDSDKTGAPEGIMLAGSSKDKENYEKGALEPLLKDGSSATVVKSRRGIRAKGKEYRDGLKNLVFSNQHAYNRETAL